MKTQKQTMILFSMTFLILTTFTNLMIAQEKRPAALEKWIGTWELELYKIEPDSMMKYTGYTRPNILEMEWSVDSVSVIQTLSRYYQGQWIKSVTLLVHDFEKNETIGLGSYGTEVETFQGNDSSTIKSFAFDGTLQRTQTVYWESKDRVHTVSEIFSTNPPIKAYFRIKRK